jgi:hypothetical protein
MTTPRLVISALVSVAAMFVAVAWLPANALAQGSISITSAGPDGSGDPYDLTVVADDANGLILSSMTVHFLRGSTDVYDVTDMQYDGTSPADAQIWTPATPIPSTALPAGTYTMTVDASDSSPETDDGLAAGTITITYSSTNVTVTPSQSSVTYGSQNVTFSGSVTGTAEDGTQVPIPGVQVSVSDGNSVTTDSNGDFSYTATGISQTTDYDFSVAAGDGSYPAGDSGPITITAEQATTSMTVTPSPPTVTQGSQDVTFNGTVQVTPPGGSATGVGSGVEVYLSIGGGTPGPVTTTDDANGDFTYTVDNIAQDDDYDFSVQAGALYTAASDDVTVDTVAASTTLSVTPTPAEVSEGQQNITFTGTVQVTPSGGSLTGIGQGIPVDLSIGGVPQGQVTSTTDANGDFSYTVPDVTTTTDYDFSVGTTNLYTSASEDVEIPIVPAVTTVDVSASPMDVTFGSQSVTFTGSVTALAPGTTTPVGVGSGVPVDLTIGSSGTPTPVTSTTDAAGDFSYTVSGITSTTTYSFSVGQQQDDLYGLASDSVTVNADSGTTNVMVTASPADVNLGSSTVTFTGTVSVLPAGSTQSQGIGSGVQVYLSVGGGSATAATTTTDAAGDFSYTLNNITQKNDYDFIVDAGPLYTAGSDDVPIGFNQLNTDITVVPSQTSVTEGSQDVTFTGTVTGAPPGSTTQQSIGSPVPIDLRIAGGPLNQVVTTGTNGKFTYRATGISRVTAFDFSVGSTTTYTAATEDVSIGLSPARTRITKVSVSPAHLKYGQKATLKGTVEYLSGKTWTDLPRATVKMSEGKTNLGTAHAGPNGSFAASLPSTHGLGWSAVVPQANLIQQGTVTGNLSIAVPTKLQSFRAGLGVNGQITVAGCLAVTVPVGYAPLTKIAIQYASAARGPWKTLGQLQLRAIDAPPRDCGAATESHFSGSIHIKLADAYYRAEFPASYSFESAVGTSVHLWKYQTRITSYTVSPRSVKTRQKVTITGQLWAKTKGWRPFANQRVEIIYNDKGTSYWGSLGTAKTNSHGDFKAYALSGAGTFVAIIYAEYAGGKTDFEVRTNGDDLSINPGGSSVAKAAAAQPASSQATDAASTGASLPVLLQPEQLGFADALQTVLTATREVART